MVNIVRVAKALNLTKLPTNIIIGGGEYWGIPSFGYSLTDEQLNYAKYINLDFRKVVRVCNGKVVNSRYFRTSIIRKIVAVQDPDVTYSHRQTIKLNVGSINVKATYKINPKVVDLVVTLNAGAGSLGIELANCSMGCISYEEWETVANNIDLWWLIFKDVLCYPEEDQIYHMRGWLNDLTYLQENFPLRGGARALFIQEVFRNEFK